MDQVDCYDIVVVSISLLAYLVLFCRYSVKLFSKQSALHYRYIEMLLEEEQSESTAECSCGPRKNEWSNVSMSECLLES